MPDVSELKRLYDEYNNQEARTLTIGGSKGFSFKVKYRLNMDEATALVHEVCNGVFDPGVCEYRPELKDYCLRGELELGVRNTYICTNNRLLQSSHGIQRERIRG